MTRRDPATRATRVTRNRLHRERGGQVTLEWALLLAAVGLPLVALMGLCLQQVSGMYRALALLISLPAP